MFKKSVIIGLSVVLLASAANAQGYHRDYRGGGGWVAPFVGGAIIGGIIGGAIVTPRVYEPPVVVAPPVYPSNCWDEIVGYDVWHRPIVRRFCR
jgi:hypothetical protein